MLTAWALTACATHPQKLGRDGVTLYLDVSSAGHVAFVCSLDQFRIRPMEKIGNDIWSIRVPADQYFSYYYIVDGELHIPDCSLKETDDFGSENCIYEPAMGLEVILILQGKKNDK